VQDDVRAGDQRAHGSQVTDIRSPLVDGALELGVVERNDVEGAHVMTVGKEPPREVQAEEARAARNRPEHRARG
jgi:hypothetical protein